MVDSSMNRRDLLIGCIAVVGSSAPACLENRADGDPPTDPENNDIEETDMNDSSDNASNDNQGSNHGDEDIREKQFTTLGTDYEVEVAASVTFETDSIIITGTIRGNNTCYTARLDTVTTENGTLLVNVESYEDADENEGCRDAEIGIGYETTIEFDGELPTTVTVEHNGEKIRTEHPS